MSKSLDALLSVLDVQSAEVGVELYGIVHTDGFWKAFIFDQKRADKFRGERPVESHMRDDIDFAWELKSWRKAGIVQIAQNKTLQETLVSTIRALAVYRPGDIS